jgi:hypothetical protein
LIAAVLNALEDAGCPATLVGACAVAARSGQYLRPVRDIDIYTRRESVAMHVLESAGLQRIAPSKLSSGKYVVDIVHPRLPRINRSNRLLLDLCLDFQSIVETPIGADAIAIRCPRKTPLLALKVFSFFRRTLKITRRHDLSDAITLFRSGRSR